MQEKMERVMKLMHTNANKHEWTDRRGKPCSHMLGAMVRHNGPILGYRFEVSGRMISATKLRGSGAGTCVTVSAEEFGKIVAELFVLQSGQRIQLDLGCFDQELRRLQVPRPIEIRTPFGTGGSLYGI